MPSTNGGGIVRGVRGRIISERGTRLEPTENLCAARRCVSSVGLLLSWLLLPTPATAQMGHARLGESQRRLPGDEIIPNPTFETTHAGHELTPRRKPCGPWIAQMGRGLTGYLCAGLAAESGVPSVDFLRQDLAALVDQAMDGGFILNVVPGRMLLFGGFVRSCRLGPRKM